MKHFEEFMLLLFSLIAVGLFIGMPFVNKGVATFYGLEGSLILLGVAIAMAAGYGSK